MVFIGHNHDTEPCDRKVFSQEPYEDLDDFGGRISAYVQECGEELQEQADE